MLSVSWLWASISTPIRESVCPTAISAAICCYYTYYTNYLLARWWGKVEREHFAIFWLHLSLLVSLCLRAVTFTCVSLVVQLFFLHPLFLSLIAMFPVYFLETLTPVNCFFSLMSYRNPGGGCSRRNFFSPTGKRLWQSLFSPEYNPLL